MPIQITINGENAEQAIQELVAFAALVQKAPGASPVTTTAPVSQTVSTTVPTSPAPAAPIETPATVAAPTAVPTSVPQYDFNQLATATMQLQQAGQNIYEIFTRFGIQALNQLPKERYAEYAATLRERGAKI